MSVTWPIVVNSSLPLAFLYINNFFVLKDMVTKFCSNSENWLIPTTCKFYRNVTTGYDFIAKYKRGVTYKTHSVVEFKRLLSINSAAP